MVYCLTVVMLTDSEAATALVEEHLIREIGVAYLIRLEFVLKISVAIISS